MSTPALARATEALSTHGERVASGAERGTPSAYARAVVSAALHDPDDPEGLWLYGAAIDAGAEALGYNPLPETYIKVVRAAVDAVRAAILGEAS